MKKRYRHREPRTPRQRAPHVPIPRLVLIILAALALATAAACSSSSSGGSGGGSSGQVLEFPSFVWHGTDGPDGFIYDAVRVAFQKDNPGVKVDNSLIPFDNYFTKTYSDMVAGAAQISRMPTTRRFSSGPIRGSSRPLTPICALRVSTCRRCCHPSSSRSLTAKSTASSTTRILGSWSTTPICSAKHMPQCPRTSTSSKQP